MLEYLTKARHSETAVQSKVEESRAGFFGDVMDCCLRMTVLLGALSMRQC